MKILFVTTNSYFPQRVGGAESSTHDLCREALGRGHKVAVLAGLDNTGVFSLYARLKMKLPYRGSLGVTSYRKYPVFRCWDIATGLTDAAEQFQPDIAVVQAGNQLLCVHTLVALGVPTILYLRNNSFAMSRRKLPESEKLRVIANSEYTARFYKSVYSTEVTVIPPLVRRESYYTETSRKTALFVNPHPYKGVDTVISLAKRNPGVEFEFVRGWPLKKEDLFYVEKMLADSRNIRVTGPFKNMRTAYGRAKLLLAPTGTQFQGKSVEFVEAWGRVCTEAHFSGIPVLATRDGGFPESVGPGGVLIPKGAGIEEWDKSFKKLWHDQNLYCELARSALLYSERSEISPKVLFDRFFSACGKTILGLE